MVGVAADGSDASAVSSEVSSTLDDGITGFTIISSSSGLYYEDNEYNTSSE